MSWRDKERRKLINELIENFCEDSPTEAKEGVIRIELAEFDMHFNIK